MVRRVGRSRVLGTCVLAALWLCFGGANLRSSLATGRPVGLGATALELVIASLFVLRRQPLTVSRSPLAWLAAAGGGFGLLAARPAFHPLGGVEPLYLSLQLAGVLAASASLLSLGRSFGIVAANRGVHTGGPYRLVRHPAYACFLVTSSGYLLENPSLRNCLLLTAVAAFQIVRIHQEERCLSSDPRYAAYRTRVRYRLLPFVY